MDRATAVSSTTVDAKSVPAGLPAPHGGKLPEHPSEFIARAERLTNQANYDGAARLYAEDAQLELITDGGRETHRGRSAIRQAWRIYMAALGRRGLRVHKTLLATSNACIANEWHGELANGSIVCGMEYWVFNARGEVSTHKLLSFLDVRPAYSARQRARMALGHPSLAASFVREMSRHGGNVAS